MSVIIGEVDEGDEGEGRVDGKNGGDVVRFSGVGLVIAADGVPCSLRGDDTSDASSADDATLVAAPSAIVGGDVGRFLPPDSNMAARARMEGDFRPLPLRGEGVVVGEARPLIWGVAVWASVDAAEGVAAVDIAAAEPAVEGEAWGSQWRGRGRPCRGGRAARGWGAVARTQGSGHDCPVCPAPAAGAGWGACWQRENKRWFRWGTPLPQAQM